MSTRNSYKNFNDSSAPAKSSFPRKIIKAAKKAVKAVLFRLPGRGKAVIRLIRRFKNKLYKTALLDRKLPSAYNRAAKAPVDENKIIFVEVRLPYITNSFSVIFDELLNKYDYNVHTHFLLNNNTSRADYTKRCLNAVEDMATAKYVFVNEASNALSSVKLRPETKMIQLWHGCGAFKRFGFSTADLIFGDSRKEQLKHPYYKNYSLVTVSSPEVAWAYNEAMNIPEETGIVQATGSSRTDIFYDEEFIKSAYENLYRFFPQAQGKKVILYAPTFRGRVAKAKTPDMLSVELFYEHLGDEYVLLFKHHPLVKKPPKIAEEYADFAVNMGNLLSIEELLCVSDICISDYSSLVFEYSLFERPLIFFAYDLEEYFDWRGFYYDYYALAPGLIAKTNFEMIDYIKNIETRFDKQAIKDFRYKFMRSCDGHATQRILEAMFDDLEAHKKPCDHFEHFTSVPKVGSSNNPYFKRVQEIKEQKEAAAELYAKASKAEVKSGSIVALDIGSNVIEYMLKKHGHDTIEFIKGGEELSAVMNSLAAARYVLIDQPNPLLDSLKLRAETKVILLPENAYPLKAFGKATKEYRSGLKKEQYALAPLYGSVDMLACASEETGEIFRPAVGEVELLNIGDMKTDAMFDEAFKEAARSKLYERYPSFAGRKIIAYITSSKKKIPDPIVYEYLHTDYVLIKCRVGSKKPAKTSAEYADSIADVTDILGVYPVLTIADIAIGDFNAEVFTFMATSKPLFIYRPNYRQALLKTESLVDIEEVCPTMIYEDFTEIINAIMNIESYDYSKYSGLKEKYLKYCDGGSAARLISSLE